MPENAQQPLDHLGRIIPVLYEDNHLLVVHKPAGLLVQQDKTGDWDLLRACKRYLKERYLKPGNVFLGLIHRLDRPVSGVVVLARTSKAAARISDQIRGRLVEKEYIALVSGKVEKSGTLIDHIVRGRFGSHIAPQGKRAELRYICRGSSSGASLVHIQLVTGRHHQIRVQFAHRGHPLLGDYRYAQRPRPFGREQIALHGLSYACRHPTKGEWMTFSCLPDSAWDEWRSLIHQNNWKKMSVE